ncbi:hypothetical protein GCM10010293_61690 [Streptomyces griseoflavus]|nr:hypothetical protein GCM10010293_61690 [Streptomyces griseoflavus]
MIKQGGKCARVASFLAEGKVNLSMPFCFSGGARALIRLGISSIMRESPGETAYILRGHWFGSIETVLRCPAGYADAVVRGPAVGAAGDARCGGGGAGTAASEREG